MPCLFVSGEEMVTVGVDLRNKTGLLFLKVMPRNGRIKASVTGTSSTFGCYGCWVMDDDGNSGYVSEDDYNWWTLEWTEEERREKCSRTSEKIINSNKYNYNG